MRAFTEEEETVFAGSSQMRLISMPTMMTKQIRELQSYPCHQVEVFFGWPLSVIAMRE
jgi:hypothetical protein